MKKILIVGGTGFLGFHFARFCLKKKFKVFSLSRNKAKKIRYFKNVNYLFADISNKEQVFKTLKKLKKIDYVVNFGGEVDHKNLKKTFNSHYLGLKNLINFFLQKDLKKFIQIGSSLEYGNAKSPQKETYRLRPKSNYSKAKANSSIFVKNVFKNKKFPVMIIRPYQIYGPYQDLNRFIPIIINNCLQNRNFPCSDGNQFRDFLYIDDFVKYLFILMNKINTDGEVFNMGSGKPKKIKTIISLIKKKIKKGVPNFGQIKLRPDENLKTYPDISKLKKFTNRSPRINFMKGLIKTIKFYKKNKL